LRETIVHWGGRTADRRKHPRSRGEEPNRSKGGRKTEAGASA
jgi:hypothetical protein